MISVIIPARNEAESIAKTLASIKANFAVEMKNFSNTREAVVDDVIEIIVVCDNCSDDTANISRIYSESVLQGSFGSASAARNAGAEVAKQDILVFVDADTPVQPRYLTEILKASSAGIDYGCAPFVSDSGHKLGRYIAHSFNRFNRVHQSFGGNFFVRKSAFVRCQGFNTQLLKGEDTDLGIRLNKLGACYRYLENTFVIHNERKFRQHGYLLYYVRLYLESVIFHVSPTFYCKYIGSSSNV